MYLAMLVFDRLRPLNSPGEDDARRANRHSFSFMRLIYRHFLNVGDRINCVSKARRTISESRGIRRDLGRCDRQRVREHFSFAPLPRKLRFATASGFFALRAQADQWGVAANFPSSAFALISIASAVMAAGTLTHQPLGNALLPNISSLVGEGNVDGARK